MAGDPDSGRVRTTDLDPGELGSDSVNLGGPLAETSSQLLEAGKGGGAEVSGEGAGGPGEGCQDWGRTPPQVPGLRRGSLDREVQGAGFRLGKAGWGQG